MSRVLVTGGCGFLGSHLVDRLIAEGHQVRVIDNLAEQVHRGVKPAYLNDAAEYQFADVTDREALRFALSRAEVVFHFAAAVGVGQSMYSPYEYVRTNTLATAGLLQEIIDGTARPCKLVVASSMSVYGEGSSVCPRCGDTIGDRRREDLEQGKWEPTCVRCGEKLRAASTSESKTAQPASVYALTKLDQERLCLAIGKAYSVPTIALRFFNAYGTRQSLSNPYTGVAAIFSSRLRNGQPPVVYEDGGQLRDFVHVSDLVSACLLVLDRESADYQVLNVGSGKPITILDLARFLISIHGSAVQPRRTGTYRAGDIRHCFADIGALRALGYRPEVAIEDGLRELVSWSESIAAEDRFDEAQLELRRHGIA